MARKKYIDNQELLSLFEHYLLEHCSNNPRLFKIPQFGNYLRSNGFPQVADTTIRRNKEFRQALNDKLELFEDDTYQTVITYKTLDVERFLMTNRTPKAIKSALMELNNENNTEIKEQTALNKELLEENKKLRNLLKTSLYPDIANELLKEEGLLKSDQQLVTKKYLSENIITSDSKISFEKHTHTEKQTIKSKIFEIKDLLDNKTKY